MDKVNDNPIKKMISRITKMFCLLFVMVLEMQNLSAQMDQLTFLQAAAQKNYPLSKQYDLLRSTESLGLDNLAKSLKPGFIISGQATYQSDVTHLPISIPGQQIPIINKDQYRVVGEVNQTLTGFYKVGYQEKLWKAEAASEFWRTNVEMYKLRERVMQLYAGIALLNAQLNQVQLQMNDLNQLLKKTKVQESNGVVAKNNIYLVEVEILKLEQKREELNANKVGYTDALSLLTGIALNDTVVFVKDENVKVDTMINRPEINYFEYQLHALKTKEENLELRKIPNAELFLQAGYGRPGMNMLNNNFKGFYIGGLRFKWNLTDLTTLKNDRAILHNQQESLIVQKQIFYTNTRTQMVNQLAEIRKMESMILKDEEILLLRKKILDVSKVQLENGIISMTDYLIQWNAESQAQQIKQLHELQLAVAYYNLHFLTGNN